MVVLNLNKRPSIQWPEGWLYFRLVRSPEQALTPPLLPLPLLLPCLAAAAATSVVLLPLPCSAACVPLLIIPVLGLTLAADAEVS